MIHRVPGCAPVPGVASTPLTRPETAQFSRTSYAWRNAFSCHGTCRPWHDS
jgi:hypothetical protein